MDGPNNSGKTGGVKPFSEVPEADSKTTAQDIKATKSRNGRTISLKKSLKSLKSFFTGNKKSSDQTEKKANLSDRKVRPSNPPSNHATRNSLKPLSDSIPDAVLNPATIPLLSDGKEAINVDITVTIPDTPAPDAPVPEAPVPDGPVADAPIPDNPVLDTYTPEVPISEPPVPEPSAPSIVPFTPLSSSPEVTPVPEEPEILLEEVPAEVITEVASPVELLPEAASAFENAAPTVEAGTDAIAPLEAAGDVVPPIEIGIDITTETVKSQAEAVFEASNIDAGIGAISHGITMGLKLYKLSKLEQRKIAFETCPKLVKKWDKLSPKSDEVMTVQDMKDYGRIAKLSADDATSVSEHDSLRMVLGENKCRYANDQQVLRLTNNLLKLTEQGEGVTKGVHQRLETWQKEFKNRAETFEERLEKGETGKEHGILKAGHQSKKMMKAFNDIVKTMGVKIDYSTPVKQGKSGLSSGYVLVSPVDRYLI